MTDRPEGNAVSTPDLPVILELGVASRPPALTLAEASRLATVAADAGVIALRLRDTEPEPRQPHGGPLLDPSVVAAYLAGRESRLGYLVDVPTTHHAPYNVARRVLSLDRASAGRVGVVLRPGEGDEVSDAVAPAAPGSGSERWAEYATVLAGLWDSFPREALVGDVAGAVVVRDELLRPIRHAGRFYRVAGPIDGPSSLQGRPLLLAADADLRREHVAAHADAVILDVERDSATIPAADELLAALGRVGRERRDIRLVGRWSIEPQDLRDASALVRRVTERSTVAGLDAVVLAPRGAASVETTLREVVPALVPAAAPRSTPRSTLRDALRLAEVAA